MKIRPMQTRTRVTDFGARAVVSMGEVAGAAQVVLSLSTEDAMGIPTMLAHLKLSPTEARELGARLVKASEEVALLINVIK